MLRLFTNKLALFFLFVLILFCQSCDRPKQVAVETIPKTTPPEIKQPEVKQPEKKPVIVEPKPNEQIVIKATAEPPNIVAKIGDDTITKQELEKRLMNELRPRYEDYGTDFEPVDAKTVLMEMIAEKAMVMEARKQNYQEDELIHSSTKRFRDKKLINLLLQRHLQGKIKVTESEIDEKVKANPKLNRARAKVQLQRAKASRLIWQYYNEIYKRLNVQKMSDNFPRAAEIHNRLLYRPKEPRKLGFIQISQIKNELTDEEKKIALATYDSGIITLKDWFDTLCEMSPPSRPKDLHTTKGVERLLDRALSTPLFVAEATLLGFDKDEDLVMQVKAREDMSLLGKAKSEKVKDIEGPTDEEEIIAYFNENKEAFGTSKTIKVDQIWCENLMTAQKVKTELSSGEDFESVKEKYTLQKKSKAFHTNPGQEGIFFKDLWNSDPNEIVGPLKGFFGGGVKWRVVKVLEKKAGEVKEYSSDMKDRIRWRITDGLRKAALEKYKEELLQEYSYKIYEDRIKDINPFDIP